MSEQLDSDQLNRLWEHGLHEDTMFNERLNFFLVFESILIAIVTGLHSQTSEPFLEKIVTTLGLLTTIVWGYTQAQQKYILEGLLERTREVIPEYRLTVERRRKVNWPIRNLPILAYGMPALVSLLWITLLFML